jgi:hypothetical protein
MLDKLIALTESAFGTFDAIATAAEGETRAATICTECSNDLQAIHSQPASIAGPSPV